MKYFKPIYWFKLLILIAPFLNFKNQGIYAKSIANNLNIKDWASKNITYLSLLENQKSTLLNNQTFLDLPLSNSNLTTDNGHHKHRHQKYRNKLRRTLDGQNEIRGSWGTVDYLLIPKPFLFYFHQILVNKRTVTCSFTPKTFEDLIRYYYKDMDWSYGKRFLFKIKTLYYHHDMYDNSDISITATFPLTWKQVENIGEIFYKKFLIIEKEYVNSSKKERIETIFTYYYKKVEFKSVRIITEDAHYYPNNLLDNLERDFPDWNKNININLGLINDNNDINIKKSLNRKYPNLKLHCIDIFDKQFSYFLNSDKKTESFGGFSAKIFANNTDNNCYSYGLTKPNFTYVTQDKLNGISNIIANHHLTKLWINHINNWNTTTLPIKFNELNITIQHLKNTYPLGKKLDEKINIKKQAFKVEQKETIKTYIRDWNIVSTLVEHELKLDELNKNVQGIKADFEQIKIKVNELDSRVQNLENQSNVNCANIAGITSTAISSIPVIGNIAAGVTAMISGGCAIAGV